MDMFVIQGGIPLKGRVAVGGAKNAALPIMAAALIADGPSTLYDVPNLIDVSTLSQLLGTLGVHVQRQPDGSMQLEVVDDKPYVAEYDLVRRMRASFCVLGPLLTRRGKACVSLPGGCNIGARPIDLHLKGLQALGADIRVERGYVIAQADRLRGNRIYLGGPCGSTVTGTCNVMVAAALAEGTTMIEAASCEPEVADLGSFLNKMGARIDGLGTPFLTIEGVESLRGTDHTVVPDRIESATLMIAVAMTRGEATIEHVRLDHLTAVVEKLRAIGVTVEAVPGWDVPGTEVARHQNYADSQGGSRTQQVSLRVSARAELTSEDVSALPYPGIPTDLQAQLMALLSRANGISIVTDKVFPDRFMHVPELVRLGARIRREGPSAIIRGVPQLSGACIMASDLRASAALVLAALAAEGESVVRRIYHLDRGYDRLERKLECLGASISRRIDEPNNMPASLKLAESRPVLGNTKPALLGPKWLTRQANGKRRA